MIKNIQMRRINFLNLLVIATLLCSCVETIEMDTVPVNKILVVNSLIAPDSLFWCYVSKVYALNDSTPHYVDNASVKIFDNSSGALVCELVHGSAGMYRALNSTAKMDKEYRIEVSANGFPTVLGTTQIPHKQEATDVSYISYAGYDALQNCDYDELRFSIKDQFEESNYYEVLFFTIFQSDSDWIVTDPFHKISTDTIWNMEDASGFADYTIVDAVLKAEGLMKYNPSTLVFSDNLFNLQKHDFVVRHWPLSSHVCFTLYTLSEELYKFRTTLTQHLYERGAKGISRYDDFAGLDFSSKAIDVYSNLNGGYGIFAGYNSQTLFTKFDTITHIDPYTGKTSTSIRNHCDTLPDGRVRIIIDQLKNPYEK